MSKRGSKFKYINEGNVHIVLQILNTNKVIRLVKEDNQKIQLSTITNSIQYVNKIMVPLIFGDDHYHQEVTVLSENEIFEISTDIEKWRPNHRKAKSKLSSYAITVPNLTISSIKGDNYCLEIKPKEGFIDAPLRKCCKCHYCLKQYLKLNNGEITNTSEYCPLDLFSGVYIRMKYALHNLLQNPQNNLKLFQNGIIVFSDNLKTQPDFINDIFGSLNVFLNFIITVLLCRKSNTRLIGSDEINDYKRGFNCNETNELDDISFLYKLLSVQKLANGLVLDLENNNDHVTEVLNTLEEYKLDLSQQCDREKFVEVSNARDLALISAVAKDCSIMLSFTLEHESDLPHIVVNGRHIHFRLSVTDLEPKTIKTLQNRQNSEEKFIKAFEQYKNSIKS
ncbi:inositol-pentakisphosphate 2-kinase-like isoform X1 [Aricia agestis]|uniref:inositol-pentakisphosphate 2-kinase-like isoform X1 n=1 Tax=Aricia agestis TaxID=91739 RepID=UPI001C20C331|nr:inositol-pentakisphosphate 2-kinase-like isoform X1 [Aricia agestis]